MEREAEKVPNQMPILVLGNHRDMGHHRTVTAERANSMADSLQRERLVKNDGPEYLYYMCIYTVYSITIHVYVYIFSIYHEYIALAF